MKNIIKIKSAEYKKYEELLLKKEELIKEANKYKKSFESKFDSLNKEIYIAKYECVKKKKIITYCKNMLNIENKISRKKLDEFVNAAMKEYQEMIDILDSTKEYEQEKKQKREHNRKIKIIYHRIAKLIHPDMNSILNDDEQIQDLWNRTLISYDCNNLNELEEIEVLANKYLESINEKHYDVEIPDLSERINNLNNEIYTITHTYPYQYKHILQNKKYIDTKKDELYDELNNYNLCINEYNKQIETYNKYIKD